MTRLLEIVFLAVCACSLCGVHCHFRLSDYIGQLAKTNCSVDCSRRHGHHLTPLSRRAKFAVIRKIRLQKIKDEILQKLRLSKKPNVTRGKIPAVILDKAMEKIFLAQPAEVSDDDGEVESFASISEMVSFSEDDGTDNTNVIQFKLGEEEAKRQDIIVTHANVWIFFKYKKYGETRNPARNVTVLVHEVNADGTAADVVESFRIIVRHSKWRNIKVPINVIQKLFDNVDHKLRLYVTCRGCGEEIKPLLARRRKRKHSQKRRQRKLAMDMNRKHARQMDAMRAATKRQRVLARRLHKRRKHKKRSNFFKPNRNVTQRVNNKKSQKKLNKRRPFLVIRTKIKTDKRRRRSLDCNSRTRNCCKRSFFVDFRDLEWDDWIIAPHGYNANYCTGKCDISTPPYIFTTSHSSVMSGFVNKNGKRPFTSCCTPKKMSPLSLLHFDKYNNVVKTDLLNMKVDSCGCV